MDKTKPVEERFAATLKLAELPRNSVRRSRYPQPLRDHGPAARGTTASTRCRASRSASLGSKGLIPGLVKSSW